MTWAMMHQAHFVSAVYRKENGSQQSFLFVYFVHSKEFKHDSLSTSSPTLRNRATAREIAIQPLCFKHH
jgi:hypothetical protein